MNKRILVSIYLVSLLSFSSYASSDANKFKVEMFKGGFATVNSFIFSIVTLYGSISE